MPWRKPCGHWLNFMASIAETNAAFDAIEDDLHQLIAQFVPFIFKQQAIAKLESPQGRGMVLDGVRKALTAAEHIRNGAMARKKL
jgi:hypothetical protein